MPNTTTTNSSGGERVELLATGEIDLALIDAEPDAEPGTEPGTDAGPAPRTEDTHARDDQPGGTTKPTDKSTGLHDSGRAPDAPTGGPAPSGTSNGDEDRDAEERAVMAELEREAQRAILEARLVELGDPVAEIKAFGRKLTEFVAMRERTIARIDHELAVMRDDETALRARVQRDLVEIEEIKKALGIGH